MPDEPSFRVGMVAMPAYARSTFSAPRCTPARARTHTTHGQGRLRIGAGLNSSCRGADPQATRAHGRRQQGSKPHRGCGAQATLVRHPAWLAVACRILLVCTGTTAAASHRSSVRVPDTKFNTSRGCISGAGGRSIHRAC